MRQVPGAGTPIGVVGGGRLARHFLRYLQLLEIPTCAWSRRAALQDPVETLDGCGTVLLLIRDDQILPFIAAWPGLQSKRLVHCSGSLVTEQAEAAHPLMTFGPDLYDIDVYRQTPFILERGRTPFDELLPGLPNPWFTVARGDRPLYHALCVLAGNGSTLLWQKLFADFENRLGIPHAAAQPYLRQITANLVRDPRSALTGPLSRGDVDTILSNLAALDGDPFQAVYRALARTYEERS